MQGAIGITLTRLEKYVRKTCPWIERMPCHSLRQGHNRERPDEQKPSTEAVGMTTSALPYAGIRVLDLTRVLAGPFATLVLADLGAEVIKIENTVGGDDARQFQPPVIHDISTYFLSFNRNKKSVAIDLKRDAGRQLFLDLARHSDVVIENFRTGVVDRLGIDYASVKAINEDIIYCSISGYGRTGSQAMTPGYDPTMQAESGLMSISGEPDGPPTRIGASHVDMTTGLFAAQAISAALWHRRSGGGGQQIEVCLFDTALNMLLNYGATHLLTGDNPSRVGNGTPVAKPSGVYQAKDGDLMITVGSDRLFHSLCSVLNRPDLTDHPDYVSNPQRIRHEKRLDELLNAEFATQSRDHWLARLRDAGVPCAPISTIKEAFGQDLVAERELVQQASHASLGDVPSLASPMRLSATPAAAPVGAPLLGQHTEQVLREICGLDAERIVALAADGTIACHPAGG